MLLAKSEKDNIVKLPVKKEVKPRNKVLKKTVIKVPNLIIIIGVLFMIYSFGGQYIKMRSLQNEVKGIKVQMEEYKSKNINLKKEIKRMQSDLYVERMAREKLGLIKQGETPIMEAKAVEGNVIERSYNQDIH